MKVPEGSEDAIRIASKDSKRFPGSKERFQVKDPVGSKLPKRFRGLKRFRKGVPSTEGFGRIQNSK